MRELNIRWLGKLPYGEAYILQKGLHSATSQESSPFDYLLLLEHNNVVTIGRSGDINNLLVSRNILNENYETGGLYAENEVEGTGSSGTFVTPGQPFTIFGGVHLRW